ncbi:hypothetical protein Vi05172_g2198 [Venturia inaequalis]|uniref:Uncharacterized protein n=1 Tax=Venturia inaequalis TaxID=5025 RepID=A0A8H3YPX3_VENIN|nr:hypothetical protein EG327_010899 [Venturia inaequalis]RDI87598.1 hypothetical protein Vi05172_g2198 [Venturia inaequalis]
MQLSTFALASLLSLASARIVGFSVPKTIRPGEGFSAVIHTENYIQSVQDIAIAFGVTPGVGYPGSLGTTLESFYLGPTQSNIVSNITKYFTTVPKTLTPGAATLSAQLYSLYGASSSGVLSNYNVSITVANTTSTEYVSSLA